MKNRSIQGSLLLLLGAVIWGAAFVAQRAGMDHMPPFAFSGIRMLLGFAVLYPFSRVTRRKMMGIGNPAAVRALQRKSGLLCGFFLFLATSLQQVGLVSTGAGKAGFITALYVVLVPVAGLLLFRQNPGRLVWIGVVLAVAALWLLCVPPEGYVVETGDLLLVGCAVCFTAQILCVDRFAPRVDGVTLARDEFLVTGVLSVIVSLCTETISVDGIREALVPILYTGILSCGVGYTLQVLGQQRVNPTLASLIMCLESVFAVLTGALILREVMSGRELAGCALMFTAVILAQLSPFLSRKRKAG